MHYFCETIISAECHSTGGGELINVSLISEAAFSLGHRFPLISALFASTGPQCDAESAKKFFLQLYKNQHGERHKPLYTHFTCATDTKNIRVVFKAVKDTLFIDNLNTFNLE